MCLKESILNILAVSQASVSDFNNIWQKVWLKICDQKMERFPILHSYCFCTTLTDTVARTQLMPLLMLMRD